MAPGFETALSRICKRSGCGGTLAPYAGDGRFFFHRNVHINIPFNFYIPRCNKCLQDVLTDDLRMVLDEVLDEQYKLHEVMIKKCIERLKRKPGDN